MSTSQNDGRQDVGEPRISYGRQSISEADIQAVAEVLRSDALTCGPAVQRFEGAIRDVCGAAEVVAVSNGTSALRLLYQAAGIGPRTTIGVPAITFMATASQAASLGAEVVILDVDPDSYLLTPEILARCPHRLDFVAPVHYAGRMCDLPGLAAAGRGAVLVEDAAHAFGSISAQGERAGECRHSRGAIFSFHPVKNITCGEGGAISVSDPGMAERLRSLRHHGIERRNFMGSLAGQDGRSPWYHEFHRVAGNERLSDIHAALGASQCVRLGEFKLARKRIIAAYRAAAKGWDWIRFPDIDLADDPFWHLCPAWIDFPALGITRQDLFARADRMGIGLQVHYIPLHHQPVMASARRGSALDGAERAYRGLISLPCYPGLGDRGVDRVISLLASISA